MSDRDLLRLLHQLTERGAIQVEFHPKPLEHIDSPVAIEADGNIWVYGLVAIAIAIWWWGGMTAGLAAIAVGLLIYYTLAQVWMRRRLLKRARIAAEETEKWRAMWRLGGVTLTAGGQRCAAPNGNWMEFVRRSASETA